MSRKNVDVPKASVMVEADPFECPFREFRDNEIHLDSWGMGTAAYRAHALSGKVTAKPSHDTHTVVWTDEQSQPLPRSVRHYLHGWTRAEQLANDRWNADVVVYEEQGDAGRMAVADTQLSHAQVLFRSSFCRRVLSVCFMLERVDNILVEHLWDAFTCTFAEGWRPKYHIYSPGLKSGGGPQHKPVVSKNGCYLVRLFYLGAWRCVWVSDQVPVDFSGAPLLPFSPLLTRSLPKPGGKQISHVVIANVVYLWPLLLTKALLKLAAPDMNADEESDCVEDESLKEFDIMHTLTGGMDLRYIITGKEEIWMRIITEVPLFEWDDDDEITLPSTVKTKSTRKQTAKEANVVRRNCFTYAIVKDTKDLPPYYLPGITPGHQMSLLISMARDLPLKRPLPEPEVALWKHYRWVDWARRHGLYDEYNCPRTRYLKVTGLLKLSYAPHLLEVQSTESITQGFIEEHKSGLKDDEDSMTIRKDKKTKEQQKASLQAAIAAMMQMKEELREWIKFSSIQELIKYIDVLYYPSAFNYTSAGSNPPFRITKAASFKAMDIQAPKSAPLYLQIDGPEANKLRMSLSILHPRVLFNAGAPIVDFIEPANFILEKFEWFKDNAVPIPKAYVRTRGYNSVEIDFEPGRHFLRIWTHSRTNWHIMLLSESTLLLGAKDVIQGGAIKECPWASKFLLNLGAAFSNWIKIPRTSENVVTGDREFFRSYLPDLSWDNEVVGYDRSLLHWMFRQALQSHFWKRMNANEWKASCRVMRKYFCDPDLGFPKKPMPPRSVREIANLDVCDCLMPEIEEVECVEEQLGETEEAWQDEDEKPVVDPLVMEELLKPPKPPIASQTCELATEDLPCGMLKDEREKMIRQHEAAIVLQAHWRGTWARQCLKDNVYFTADVTKYALDHAFGTIEALSSLMNEFFGMFPGAKYAYSVSSALTGACGLQQHIGTTNVTTNCKWVPFFQGVFYCHAPVKVHFDVVSSIAHSTVAVYDNDTGNQLPQAYNTHITFDFVPNHLGYSVLGHGNLVQSPSIATEAHWQLTVMSCINGVFHICDNEDPCREMPIPHTYKLHLDEIFLPNRRNILGGIQISVTKHESVSFRAAATSPDLEMVAILRSISANGVTEELGTCSGKGEIYWPYIRLEPTDSPKTLSCSQANLVGRELTSSRSIHKKLRAKSALTSKNKLVSRVKTGYQEKLYSIEVVCPEGWPLTLMQWQRVDEVRNLPEHTNTEHAPKKVVKEKEKPTRAGSAKEKEKKEEKEKEKVPLPFSGRRPQPGDASVELECALAIGGGAIARRDDDRDIEFANARKAWDAKEPGRNKRGEHIRKAFRNEFLEVPSPVVIQSHVSPHDEVDMFEGTEAEEEKKSNQAQGPSPASDSDMHEMTVESEEEALYPEMPDQLRDKFIPLYFLPFCMKENEEESVYLTPDMAEAAKKDREARIEAALERMRELQVYNEEHVLGRQKNRCMMLEKLFVDATLCPQLIDVMEQREKAIVQEVLNRNLSATKKKLEAKAKAETKQKK